MFFHQMIVGPMQNFSYLIGCEKTKECAVIDCGFEPEKISAVAQKNGYDIVSIFLTHVHYDHSGAADILSKLTGAKIYAHRDIEVKREKNADRGAWVIPASYFPLDGDDRVAVGNLCGKTICAPGHQSDHLLYLFEPYLFTGDTLFIGGVGRTDFPDSDPLEMSNTLNKILELSDELIICSGHDYGRYKTRKLGEEKKNNPYLFR